MSRSYKKAILKDKGNSDYNKIIRRVNKQIVKSIKYDDSIYDLDSDFIDLLDNERELKFLSRLPTPQEDKIKHSKEIVNQYDICDYIIDLEHNSIIGLDKIKYRRK